MSTVRFLVDENVDNALLKGLLRREPAMDIIRVGHSGAPPTGISDQTLLLAVEAATQGLITLDHRTMPQHIADYLGAGHHTWGVFILKQSFPLVRYLDDLLLIWSASAAEEWRDCIVYLPWPRPE